MVDHEFYHNEQTAKMREMETASRDRTPLWDLGESCAERSARFDMAREAEARIAQAGACVSWAVSDVGPSAAVTFNARFVDALEEEK